MAIEERQIVRELVEAILCADGSVSEAEREYMRGIAKRLGLPPSEGGRPTDVGQATTKLRALAPDIQKRVLAILVDAAVVDGHVDPQERMMLLAAAASLGIEAIALEERIAWRLRANNAS
jgi:tellurite resistance protein